MLFVVFLTVCGNSALDCAIGRPGRMAFRKFGVSCFGIIGIFDGSGVSSFIGVFVFANDLSVCSVTVVMETFMFSFVFPRASREHADV
jgi:hypothetical protein